ncbi:MAG: type II secretion system protein N [Gallionellaceae bacterium]|jgi:general secretion pathway protein N
MLNRWTWILFIVTFLGALLVTAPATLLGIVLGDVSQNRLELANTQGSIWRGSANPVIRQRSGKLITLDKLHWEMIFMPLLSGKLNIQLNWDHAAQIAPMEISATPAQLEIHNALIPLPALLLDEVSDFLKPAQLRGDVILKSDSLVITPQAVLGNASADWINASSLLSTIAPLGNYHLAFSSTASGVDIVLSTSSGALILGGQGRLTATNGLDFKGTAQASKGNEDALRDLLGHLGPELTPGVSTFNLVPSRSR